MSADGFISQIPTGPAPQPVPDGARNAIAAAQAKAIAKFAPAPVATTPEPAPGTPAKIEMDPAALKQLTKTSAALRRAEQRVTELEAGAKDTGPLAEAKKLYGEGKRLEAIALLSGRDATEEMAALMEAYLDTTPKEPVDPQAAKLAELEAWKTEQTKQQDDAKKAAEEDKAKQRDAAIQGFAWSVLDAEKLPDGSAKYALSATKKNRGEAAVAALKLVSQVYAPKEHPDGNVTPEQARVLFAKAFVEVEAEYRKDFLEQYGFEYAKPGPNPRPSTGQAAQAAPRTATTVVTPPEPTRANQSPTLARSAISTTEYPKSLTPAQALAKAIEKVKSFQR